MKKKKKGYSSLDTVIAVDYMGSTAIPDIMAKPTIDILLQVSNETNLSKLQEDFENLDYIYVERRNNPKPHMMFVKGYTKRGFEDQAFHFYIRYSGDWDEMKYRDALIQNKSLAVQYESLKIQLAKEFEYDRDAYTKGKSDFVERVLQNY